MQCVLRIIYYLAFHGNTSTRPSARVYVRACACVNIAGGDFYDDFLGDFRGDSRTTPHSTIHYIVYVHLDYS